MEPKRILVPTDFSDAANRALEQALSLARTGAGEILVFHRLASPVPMVVPPLTLGGGDFQEMGRLLDDYTRELRDEASRKLAEYEKRAPRDVVLSTAIEDRFEANEAILRQAREWKADLILMGTHGRRGLDKLLIGSVATSVLHRAEQDVMLVRADSEIFAAGPDGGPILVPVDFSDHSQRALGLARVLASRYRATIELVHVVELLHTPFQAGGLSSRFEDSPALREKYEEALREMLAGTEGGTHVAEGTVAGEILWWREKLGARLVVMGSRGLSGLKHLLLGSVAEKVARFCEVPVLVVK